MEPVTSIQRTPGPSGQPTMPSSVGIQESLGTVEFCNTEEFGDTEKLDDTQKEDTEACNVKEQDWPVCYGNFFTYDTQKEDTEACNVKEQDWPVCYGNFFTYDTQKEDTEACNVKEQDWPVCYGNFFTYDTQKEDTEACNVKEQDWPVCYGNFFTYDTQKEDTEACNVKEQDWPVCYGNFFTYDTQKEDTEACNVKEQDWPVCYGNFFTYDTQKEDTEACNVKEQDWPVCYGNFFTYDTQKEDTEACNVKEQDWPVCYGNFFTYDTQKEDTEACNVKEQDWPVCYGSEDEGYEDDREDCLDPTLFYDYADPVYEEPSDCPFIPQWRPRIAPASSATEPTAGELSREFRPTDKWKTFSQSIPSELRREPFSDNNCGPTGFYATPSDAFVAIWDETIMQHMVAETNRYAEQQINGLRLAGTLFSDPLSRWKDTCVDELYRFLALILRMGHLQQAFVEEYWEDDIFFTGWAKVMSHERFVLLSKCVHFNNNDHCTPELMGATDAKLFKLQPLVDHMNDRFANLYKASRNLFLHETMFLWKRRLLSINQLIHIKASPVGIKMYELCESQSGYTLRCKVHAEQSYNPKRAKPISGDASTVVHDLLEGLHGKGHTVWMDQRLNSPSLARELKSRGTDCAGTLNTKRPFVPVELAELEIEDMITGQIYGCTSGDVDLLVWRRAGRVGLISTYHGAECVKVSYEPFAEPSILNDYKRYAKGTACLNSELSHFPIERKHTWYKMFFRRLLHISELNSYILLTSRSSNMTRSHFRKNLVKDLLKRHKLPEPKPPLMGHVLYQYEFNSRSRKRQRRSCAHCNKLTKTFCVPCNKPLCIPCFPKYCHL